MIIIETSLQLFDYGFVQCIALVREGLEFIPDAQTIKALFDKEFLGGGLQNQEEH